MVPSRCLCLAFGLLVAGRVVSAQTVVNSTFLNRYPTVGYGEYNNPSNWSSAEVPNNSAARRFDVNITTFFQVGVPIDATISNLTLGGSLTGLHVQGKTFTVTGTTTSEIYDGYIEVTSNPGAPAKFDAGTFPSFSDHTLRGYYVLRDATFQFRGADIWRCEGSLSLHRALSAIVDDAGNDALRNLGRIEASGSLVLDGRNLVANVPFLNEGLVSLQGIPEPSMFTAAAGLRNFDASTRTLSGGIFDLIGGELRFDGADVVNLASVIYLAGRPGLTDLAGSDGLRNLAHIRPGGLLSLGRDFATTGDFANDGALVLSSSTFTVTGALHNFDPAGRTLTDGTYSITRGVFRFSGADIVHNEASIILSQDPFNPGPQARITDLAGNDGLRNFSDNHATGSFILNPGQLFMAPGNFTNAGTVTTGVRYPAHDLRATPEFRVPAGSSYNQTAGATVNAGTFSAENITISGGRFLNRALGYDFGIPSLGLIKASVNVSAGMLIPSGTVTGNLTLGANARFRPTIGRFKDSVLIQGAANLGGTLEVELTGYRFPGNSEVITVLQSSALINGTFSNAANGARVSTIDGSGSFLVLYENNAVKLTGFELSPSPAQLLNISTRAALSPADDDPHGDRSILIAGFIISGAEPKKVVVRGIGPSLANAGVTHPLVDPALELHGSDGSIILTNNDWRDTQQAELTASGLAPQDDREAALIATLTPGTYTVVIREETGLEGTGLVEVYDVSGSGSSKLANISTRGFTNDANPLIGGIIAGGPGEAKAELVVRALGPSLRYSGVVNALNDPDLELRDANGNLVGSSQDTTGTPREIPEGLSSLGANESAIRVSLSRGNYTALVRAKPNRSGIALVEFYDVRQ